MNDRSKVRKLTEIVSELQSSSRAGARQLHDDLQDFLREVWQCKEPVPPVDLEELVYEALLIGIRIAQCLHPTAEAAGPRRAIGSRSRVKGEDHDERIRLWRSVRNEMRGRATLCHCAREVARRRGSRKEAERMFFYRHRKIIENPGPGTADHTPDAMDPGHG